MTTGDQRAERRATHRREKVLAWLDVIETSARDLDLEILSRHSETASETGTDPEPRVRPCEHRPEWRRGRLCLACDNTGLRNATEKERLDGLAYDPYLIDPPRDKWAVIRDQSDASRRMRDLAQLDAAIESLERQARQREGLDVSEGDARRIRVMSSVRYALGRDGRKVLEALLRLREASPALYRQVLDRDAAAVAFLAGSLIRGRLQFPA